MRTRAFFLAVALLGGAVSARAEVLWGIAKNAKGEVVYHEKHEIERDEKGLNKLIRVTYTRPSGEKIASMTSDFRGSALVPETTFEDFRFQTKSVLRLVDKKIEFEEVRAGQKPIRSSVSYKEGMVAGQGFDNFIQLNLDKLQKGPVDFQFGVLEKKDFFTLTGYQRSPAGEGHVEYGLRASSWFVRLFASELKVVYDAATRNLKSYVGRSNLLDDRGQAQDVVIEYRWKASDSAS